MPDRLMIRLAPDGGLHWLRQSADGRVVAGSGEGAPPAAVLASSGEIVVLVPAEDVLLTETRVTTRSAAQLLQAVPFAVEDQLLGALEDQHFAFAPGADGHVGVAVVARARMQAWLAALASIGVRADVVIPESLALPSDPLAATALLDGDRAIVRLGPWSAFACARSELADWLVQVRAAGFDRAIEVLDCSGAPLPALPGPVHATGRPVHGAFDLLAAGSRAPGLNLLDGEFASAHRQARGDRWWRRAAALAAGAALIAFVHRGIEVVQLGRDLARVQLAMSDSVTRTFPDLGAGERALDPQLVMRNRLERLRGGGETTGLLRVLGQIAPVFASTTRTRVRGIEYRNDTLELGLRSPDVATLDALRERVAAIPGLDAEVTAANPLENGIDGRIRVRGEGR